MPTKKQKKNKTKKDKEKEVWKRSDTDPIS